MPKTTTHDACSGTPAYSRGTLPSFLARTLHSGDSTRIMKGKTAKTNPVRSCPGSPKLLISCGKKGSTRDMVMFVLKLTLVISAKTTAFSPHVRSEGSGPSSSWPCFGERSERPSSDSMMGSCWCLGCKRFGRDRGLHHNDHHNW